MCVCSSKLIWNSDKINMSLINTELLQCFPEPYSDSDDDDNDNNNYILAQQEQIINTELLQGFPEPYSDSDDDDNDNNNYILAQQEQIINIFLGNLDTNTNNYNIKKFREFVTDNKNHLKMQKNNLNRKHYKPNRYLPIPIFEGDFIKTAFIYHDLLNRLRSNDIIELYKIGNPLIKETKGGLKLANIYKNIHNKKLGKTLDNGRNLSNGLIRIWSIINQ